jgi:uncharacterized protein
MFTTLFSKTFAILSLQLLITWATTISVINWFKKIYLQGKFKINATENEAGELDLELNFNTIKPYFWGLLIIDIIVFLLLLFFGINNLAIGLILFSIWSIITGLELALSLLLVDENLGGKVLAITASITAGAAVIGLYSEIRFGFLGPILFGSLTLLIIANIVRLFITIPRASQRVMAFFGVFVFIGYLLFDFNQLADAGKDELTNTWSTAMWFAIDIYLDIVNLFLQLLDLLSD